MWGRVLLGITGVFAATQCPCSFTVDPLANSALTTYVYPVIECDNICGPPALAYQYYSFETPLGPCRCFSSDTDLIGYYYENSSSSTSIYYQNAGTASICNPCFPSPTPSPSPSPSVSPSGMCYVVSNLLYGKVYTDGYYTVVHGINASHAYNPSPIILGINPSCTESPGVCVCSYTGGSTFSCPYTRSVTLNYQYGATTTMTFVSESPVCRYTFNMFINFNSVSPTPSTSSSFTPAGSPTVSRTMSVTISPSRSQSSSMSPSVTSSISSSQSVSESVTISESETRSPVLWVNRITQLVVIATQTSTPKSSISSDGVIGIALGSVALAGMVGIAGFQLVRNRNRTTRQLPEEASHESVRQDDDDDDDADFVETPVVAYLPTPELTRIPADEESRRERSGSTTLLQLDTEDVGAVMMFLHTRMKTATVVGSYL